MSGAASSSTIFRLQVSPQKSVNQRPTIALFSLSFDIANSCIAVFSSGGRIANGIWAGLDHAVMADSQPRVRINCQPLEQLSQFWSGTVSTKSCDQMKFVQVVLLC